LGFASLRTSWVFRLLGFLGRSSVRTSWVFRLLRLLGLLRTPIDYVYHWGNNFFKGGGVRGGRQTTPRSHSIKYINFLMESVLSNEAHGRFITYWDCFRQICQGLLRANLPRIVRSKSAKDCFEQICEGLLQICQGLFGANLPRIVLCKSAKDCSEQICQG
jgi:hypothetical protein